MNSLDRYFQQAKILVVGDVMLDKYWSGDAKRISPEAPVPVVAIKNQEKRAGGAGNVALNIAALGGQVDIFTVLGKDSAADDLLTIFNKYAIKSHSTIAEFLPTATKLRILSRYQQMIRVDFEEDLSGIDKTDLLTQFIAQLPDANAVILSDYGKGVLSNPQHFIKACKQYNIPVFIDPKGNDFGRYSGASLITPNRAEFEQIVGVCQSFDDLSDKALELLKTHNIDALLITLSEDGMLLVQSDGVKTHLPTKAQEVFDVTGAGDTVIATFATAIGAGYDYSQSMEYANLAAGIVVGKLGTSVVNCAELQNAKNQLGDVSKIYPITDLKTIIQSENEVVMTNGCFDLLHTGHVSYLTAAKALGKKLIVAVNSDKSVQRLKGKNRPIQNLKQRMEILAALECVDFVTFFDDDTPEKLYCELLPDILVKGGDYQPDELAGADCVIKNGGEVKVLHFVDGQSSSSIIKKIKNLS